MTNPSPDWLDDVLRSRPVDDDGFSARVAGLAHGEARTWWLVRGGVGLFVVACIAACSAAEFHALGLLFDDHPVDDAPAEDGRAWLDEHRADWARVVATFDGNPALRRRAGRDASAVLNDAIRRTRLTTGKTEDSLACAKEAGRRHADRAGVANRGVCDTSWIMGLASYDEWKTRPDNNNKALWQALLTMARAHLRRAANQPLVPGAPAPFAVAARDVEALGRLALNHTGWGATFFEVVADEHERAAAIGRAGDHVVVIDEADAQLLRRAWRAGVVFSGPAATDEDVAAFGRLQSVLACGGLSDASGVAAMGALFLDGHRIERVRKLDRTGCAPPLRRSLEDRLCDDSVRDLCRVVLALAPLPPFRQRVVDALERRGVQKLNLARTPVAQEPATTVQPSATTVQPSATTVQPSVTTVQPSVTTVQP
jgi:hypothetical protein